MFAIASPLGVEVSTASRARRAPSARSERPHQPVKSIIERESRSSFATTRAAAFARLKRPQRLLQTRGGFMSFAESPRSSIVSSRSQPRRSHSAMIAWRCASSPAPLWPAHRWTHGHNLGLASELTPPCHDPGGDKPRGVHLLGHVTAVSVQQPFVCHTERRMTQRGCVSAPQCTQIGPRGPLTRRTNPTTPARATGRSAAPACGNCPLITTSGSAPMPRSSASSRASRPRVGYLRETNPDRMFAVHLVRWRRGMPRGDV